MVLPAASNVTPTSAAALQADVIRRTRWSGAVRRARWVRWVRWINFMTDSFVAGCGAWEGRAASSTRAYLGSQIPEVMGLTGKKSPEEHLGFRVLLGADQLELLGALGQRHPDDVGPPQRHHRAEVAVVDRADRLQP